MIKRYIIMTVFSVAIPAWIGFIMDGDWRSDHAIGLMIGCLICTWVIQPITDLFRGSW